MDPHVFSRANSRALLLLGTALCALHSPSAYAQEGGLLATPPGTITVPDPGDGVAPTADQDNGTNAAAQAGQSNGPRRSGGANDANQIVVTASRADLLGSAATASQGIITAKEVELRPIYRPSQLYESIPGLVVTIHSGEGKANQYLIRGFNLDHGTDFANFVDDMPVNRPTNTHGQGYSDLSFLMPQIVRSIEYTKGSYYAAVGDFGSVASSHTLLANEMANEVTATVGTDGYQDLFSCAPAGPCRTRTRRCRSHRCGTPSGTSPGTR